MLHNEPNADLRIVDVRVLGADGEGLPSSYTWSVGEVKISKNGGAVANTANLPTFVSGAAAGTWRLALTAAEVNTLGSLRVQFSPSGGIYVEASDTVVAAVTATTDNAAIADAVWDESRAGHVTAGTFGEGLNVVSIASAAAATVRDAVLDYAFRSGRTVRGFFRRADAYVANRTTGLLGALATFYQPDGTTVEFTAAQNTGLGSRSTGTVTNSETP